MRLILLILLLAACGPIPVQMSSQSSKQSVKQEVANDLAADQQSSHQSESKQGTNSMPVIIICNTVSSPGGHCISPPEESVIQSTVKRNLKGTK